MSFTTHLQLCNVFRVSLWCLCRILQKIQLSLKLRYSPLSLEVDNTCTHRCLSTVSLLSLPAVTRLKKKRKGEKSAPTIPAQTLRKAAASEPLPCANSQSSDSTRSGPDGRQKRQTHDKYTHRQMADAYMFVCKHSWAKAALLHTPPHTHKSWLTCRPS